MATKEQMLRIIQDLPDDASIDDAIERLIFLARVEAGLAQIDAGLTMPHDEAVRRLRQWLE